MPADEDGISMPLTVIAYAMNISMGDILYRNPDLSPVSVISAEGPEGVYEINIPCPG